MRLLITHHRRVGISHHGKTENQGLGSVSLGRFYGPLSYTVLVTGRGGPRVVRLSRVLVRPGRESRSTPISCTGTIRPRVTQNINTPFMLLTCVCLHSSFPGVFHCTVRGGEMGGRPPLPPVGVACGTVDDNIIDGRCQYRNLTTHLIQDQDNWAGPGRLG